MVLFIIIMLVYNYIHINANTTFLKDTRKYQDSKRIVLVVFWFIVVYYYLFIIIFIQLFDEEKNKKPRNIYSIYNKYSW